MLVAIAKLSQNSFKAAKNKNKINFKIKRYDLEMVQRRNSLQTIHIILSESFHKKPPNIKNQFERQNYKYCTRILVQIIELNRAKR